MERGLVSFERDECMWDSATEDGGREGGGGGGGGGTIHSGSVEGPAMSTSLCLAGRLRLRTED